MQMASHIVQSLQQLRKEGDQGRRHSGQGVCSDHHQTAVPSVNQRSGHG